MNGQTNARTSGQVVGLAIVDDLVNAQRVLAAQRAYPESLRGLWEFPGGKVREGENPLEALAREISEELGYAFRAGQEIVPPAGRAGWPLDNGMTMRVWTGVLLDADGVVLKPADINSGAQPEGSDHLEIRWLTLDQNTEEAVEWIPADKPIVCALVEATGNMPTFC
ncbi:NUDIX domain-containing protein [Pseudoglutamicibacter cumminsii]|uniref:NUDIX domain-containing protein n=1 Tax=Pseudoglutamicibacter cumminsii TaxID=156979 RepID=UPI0026ED4E50|nr:NUDIX domain-containing protein [Pseudoglutamicibacter cumminsii]